MRAQDLVVDNFKLGLRLLHADAGLQAANDGQSVAPAVRFRRDRKRNDHVDARAGREDRAEIERLREHADHFGCAVVQPDRPPDDARIGAEPPLPQAVRENDGGRSVPAALGVVELAAKLGLDAEEAEEILGHPDADEPLGLPDAYEVIAAVVEECKISGEVLEGAVQPLPLHVVADSRRNGGQPPSPPVSELAIQTSRWQTLNCSGRNRRALTTLNMAVLAPIPSPMMRTAAAKNPASRRSVLNV